MSGPRLLNLETTTRCNGRCVYCVRDLITPEDMPWETYTRCIDAFPEAEEVWPHGIGEALMYPRIVDAIAYATNAGMKTILYTNCSLLTEEMSKGLINAGLTNMVFSVDAADADTFSKLRPGLDWDTVMRNAANFIVMGRGRVHITNRATIAPENQDQRDEIISFWKAMGVDKVRLPKEVFMPALDFSPLWSSERDRVECKAPHSHFIVRANGDAVPCCRDYWAHYKMGNVNEQEPREIWKSDKWERLRKSLLDGQNYPRLCDMCKTEHQRHACG